MPAIHSYAGASRLPLGIMLNKEDAVRSAGKSLAAGAMSPLQTDDDGYCHNLIRAVVQTAKADHPQAAFLSEQLQEVIDCLEVTNAAPILLDAWDRNELTALARLWGTARIAKVRKRLARFAKQLGKAAMVFALVFCFSAAPLASKARGPSFMFTHDPALKSSDR